MLSNLPIEVTCDKQALLDLYMGSEKNKSQRGADQAVLGSNFFNTGEFASILEQLPFIAQSDDSFKIVSIHGDTPPTVSEGTNGVIIVPLSGEVLYKTYDLLTIPLSLLPSSNITEENIGSNKIISTVYPKETVSISVPTVVRTDILFSTHSSSTAIMLLISIPKSKSWNDIVELV